MHIIEIELHLRKTYSRVSRILRYKDVFYVHAHTKTVIR